MGCAVFLGLAQRLRYITVWRSDTTGPQRYASLLLSPVATVGCVVFLGLGEFFWLFVFEGLVGGAY